MRLIDEADGLAAKPRAGGIVELGRGEIVDDHVATVRPLEKAGNMQKRGFAGA